MNENELRKKYFFVHFYTWNLEKNHSIIYIYDVLLWCCHKIKEMFLLFWQKILHKFAIFLFMRLFCDKYGFVGVFALAVDGR